MNRGRSALARRFDSLQEVGRGANEESRDKVTYEPRGSHQHRDGDKQDDQNLQHGPEPTNASAGA